MYPRVCVCVCESDRLCFFQIRFEAVNWIANYTMKHIVVEAIPAFQIHLQWKMFRTK